MENPGLHCWQIREAGNMQCNDERREKLFLVCMEAGGGVNFQSYMHRYPVVPGCHFITYPR